MAARPTESIGEDPLRRLVAGEALLDVGDQHGLVDDVAGVRLDERRDRLAEALVGHADDGGVGDRRVQLEHLLDLLRVDLLAAGVDALAAPAEQADGAVGVDAWRSRRGSSSGRRR